MVKKLQERGQSMWRDLFEGCEDEGWDYKTMLDIACNFIVVRGLSKQFKEYVQDSKSLDEDEDDCGKE